MNIEAIDEPIRMLADFSGGHAVPLRFQWSGRTYRIDVVNARWIDRSGDGYRLCYSVQVGAETYFLHFAGGQVQWWLDKVVVE